MSEEGFAAVSDLMRLRTAYALLSRVTTGDRAELRYALAKLDAMQKRLAAKIQVMMEDGE